MFSYIKGFLDCFSGFGLLFGSGVKRFVIIPLIINAGLFYLAIELLRDQLDIWLEQLLPGWLSWLEWLILPLFWIAILLIVFYTFTVIANLRVFRTAERALAKNQTGNSSHEIGKTDDSSGPVITITAAMSASNPLRRQPFTNKHWLARQGIVAGNSTTSTYASHPFTFTTIDCMSLRRFSKSPNITKINVPNVRPNAHQGQT